MSATDNENRLAALVGKSLGDFKIVEMTEVFSQDEDARYSRSIGFFRSSTIAQAFAENHTGGGWSNGIQTLFVLTDGSVGFIVKPDLVKLFNDEEEALRIKEAALAKLSHAERDILNRG